MKQRFQSLSNYLTDLLLIVELLAKISASRHADLEWQTMKKSAARAEKVASQLLLLVDGLAERHEINAGWLSAQVFIFFALALFLLPLFLVIR